jgi:hypothetical protein
MITNDQKTSLLIGSQLPEFVRDNPEYANFNLFLTAYYEWMEQNGKVTERTKNLLNYKDIDETTDEFLDYFTNDFLPYFPQEILIDKQKAVKVAREMYQTKGTPASYEFLFRILYNSDFDLFYTKEAVLKASSGNWYISKSLKLASVDPNFLSVANYRIFGESTKSIATIETSVLAGTKTEVFISNIERLFQSGEFVRVVDNFNQDVLFDGQPLRAKIVGQISQVKIDPNNRGLLYKVGDPVVVYNGLNANTGLGATAIVGETTAGSIKSIGVVSGGFGYTTANTTTPNTSIVISPTYGASAYVATLNPDTRYRANVGFIPIDSISLKKDITIGATNYFFSNIATSNANTTLANAFTYASFSTYPISSVLVTNGGGGITTIPDISAVSNYATDIGSAPLDTLGILGPIQIINAGQGYRANDKIVFAGGTGLGATANVISVSGTGAILNVTYVYSSTNPVLYPLGGIGYNKNYLPGLTVNSANTQAYGAVLSVPGILGQGAVFAPTVDRTGSITSITITEPGEDYIATPNVSLKIQDIVVSNVTISNLPSKGDYIYQGANTNVSTYAATVDSISVLEINGTPSKSLYNLRVFNYNSNPDTNKTLNIDRKVSNVDIGIHMKMANTQYDSTYNQYGYKTYGDGTAKATASFLNGLVLGQGQYLTSQGQPSSFDILQNTVYNNFTYQITVQKEIEKYRSVLLNLLHPTGMNVIGRYAVKSQVDLNYHGQTAVTAGLPLDHYTGYLGTSATMTTDFVNKSNNIIQLNNLAGADISTFIFPYYSYIKIIPVNGPNVYSYVTSVVTSANTVTIASNIWLTYSNVAVVTGTTGTNTINITSITNSYNVINNGIYSNTAYPLKDIVYAGDKILVDNNTSKVVSSVDYILGKIYLTTNLTSSANSFLSVSRTFTAAGDKVEIYGPIGTQYIPQLTTEAGQTITTEDGNILLLG